MDFTLTGLWSQMGPVAKGVVIILLIMSMYSLGITIERLIAFRRSKQRSAGYIGTLEPMIKGGKIREALALDVRFKGGHVSDVVGAGVNEYIRGLEALAQKGPDEIGDFDVVDIVYRAMERRKDRVIADLRRGLSVLATVSSSAPFVGLFGTVFGIITAFQKMAGGGGGGLGTVSAGISEALLTTAVGLAVAIIAVWFYNYFTTKVEDFTVDIDETASELVEVILKEGRSAPGPVTRALKTQV